MALNLPLNYTSNLQTEEQVRQALRDDLIGEYEAVSLYSAHLQSVQCPLTKAVLEEIINDEKSHISLLNALLMYLEDETALTASQKGIDEFNQMLDALQPQNSTIEDPIPESLNKTQAKDVRRQKLTTILAALSKVNDFRNLHR